VQPLALAMGASLMKVAEWYCRFVAPFGYRHFQSMDGKLSRARNAARTVADYFTGFAEHPSIDTGKVGELSTGAPRA
jgi:hypothetical protein